MRAKLVEMKKASADDDAKLKTAWNTMLKLIGNVAQNPGVVKYRSIKLGNPAFHSKVASVPHSLEFLEIVGFKVRVMNTFRALLLLCVHPVMFSAI